MEEIFATALDTNSTLCPSAAYSGETQCEIQHKLFTYIPVVEKKTL